MVKLKLPPQPSIAIIGAGPAGLTTALLLHAHNMAFTLFEQRPQPTLKALRAEQPSSGLLHLHNHSGLAALRAAGNRVYADFCNRALATTITPTSTSASSTARQISRLGLTALLLHHLPPDCIRWGHRLRNTRRAPDNSRTPHALRLDFGEGSRQPFDFVIGADGRASKLRAILSGRIPKSAGVRVLSLTITGFEQAYPELAREVDAAGGGGFVARGKRVAVEAFHYRRGQGEPADVANVNVYFRWPADAEAFNAVYPFSTGTADPARLAATTARLLAAEESFYFPTAAQLVAAGFEELAATGVLADPFADIAADDADANAKAPPLLRPLRALPATHSWEPRADATLLGDAAHLHASSPWSEIGGSEGVDLAMRDALELVGAIVRARDRAAGVGGAGDPAKDKDAEELDEWHRTLRREAIIKALEPEVAKFEREMMRRARKSVGAGMGHEGRKRVGKGMGDEGLEGAVLGWGRDAGGRRKAVGR
ncbi:uncharacterized protein K452DRAFT_166979 [Aplosporella prunicola CBS 121167]|uniref:FAD-binding domain-containing protein n=1 Tax=Aplosporella prunicola CBS 121167 TaxID=1176127 RepID=A0A6A6BIJ0_9PEZI|nr:uncharacterized protein K452DRAFT_166979 [Aplosporella prunicola CBS 121167]KAF2143135.1 hypothetical protein K452DRAFT_166979 [Aplosporella prunicola CBS 121167]